MMKKNLKYILGIVTTLVCSLVMSAHHRPLKRMYVDGLYCPKEEWPVMASYLSYTVPQLSTYYMDNMRFYNRITMFESEDFKEEYPQACLHTPIMSEFIKEINDSISKRILTNNLRDVQIKYSLDNIYWSGINAYKFLNLGKEDIKNYNIIFDAKQNTFYVDIETEDPEDYNEYFFRSNKIFKVSTNNQLKDLIKGVLRENQLNSEKEALEVVLYYWWLYSGIDVYITNIKKEELDYSDNYFTGYEYIDGELIIIRILTDHAFEYINKIGNETLLMDVPGASMIDFHKFRYDYELINGTFQPTLNEAEYHREK